jgi:hypothetical protein
MENIMKNNKALDFAGILFGFVALIHLARFYFPFTVIIGSFAVPHWISPLSFILFGLLSGWMFRAKERIERVEILSDSNISNKGELI